MADCRPGHGTPIDLDKLRSLQVMSRKPYTPGWSVKTPDGEIVDQADGPVAAKLEATVWGDQ